MAQPLPRRVEPAAPPVDAATDFRLTDEDLRRISQRGRVMLGLELGEGKRQMVYSRLSRRLRALKMSSFAAYLDFLHSVEGEAEREHFANALTTNLTSFWREGHHFEHLEQEIRKPQSLPGNRLRIWSAGCSTGEEPYTIAMILHANSEILAGRDRRVLATDIDTSVLASAVRGTFPEDRLRPLPKRFRGPAYLEAAGTSQSVTAPVRDLVVFRTLNLIGAWPFKGRFNIIFCRNVLIYFAPELRAKMIDRFADLIHPGGLLYLGHSESMLGGHPKLSVEGHTIYRKIVP